MNVDGYITAPIYSLSLSLEMVVLLMAEGSSTVVVYGLDSTDDYW